MGFLDDLKKNFDVAADMVEQRAKKTYHNTKIEFKIRALNKNVSDIAEEIGILTYASYKAKEAVSEAKVHELCTQIDAIKAKIHNLEKHKDNYETSGDFSQNAPNPQSEDDSRYASLSRTENDMVIKRTNDGIKFMKFCPNCNVGTDPGAAECKNCDYLFN